MWQFRMNFTKIVKLSIWSTQNRIINILIDIHDNPNVLDIFSYSYLHCSNPTQELMDSTRLQEVQERDDEEEEEREDEEG